MKLEVVPKSTIVTDIITTFYTTLKINGDLEIDVKITEKLSDLHDQDSSDRSVYTSFSSDQDSIKHMNSSELEDLLDEVSNFVEENIDDIIKDSQK
ncbi:MAG TPA: hypothetical protein PLL26_02765 [Candidatus Dojkabacteria bacterium]|nr:hypothetical protein [Candidatus Dojkabacteria bacterium]